jgi:hypothetical protein
MNTKANYTLAAPSRKIFRCSPADCKLCSRMSGKIPHNSSILPLARYSCSDSSPRPPAACSRKQSGLQDPLPALRKRPQKPFDSDSAQQSASRSPGPPAHEMPAPNQPRSTSRSPRVFYKPGESHPLAPQTPPQHSSLPHTADCSNRPAD